jgi:hypothetical protein
VVTLAPSILIALPVFAQTYTSPSYEVDEVFMGPGGLNDASSANYNARATLGDTAVGNSESANFQAYGGFTTTDDPYIEVTVAGGNIDLGYLSESQTTTTTATFSVKTYLANGYNVVIGSDPPTVGGSNPYALATNSTPTAPAAPGTEQFGMNLVANTSPTTFGANPVQDPSATFSNGQVDADYATPNLFMYQKNDRIAFSNESSGFTNFTISYIFNIDEITPSGEYTFEQIIIATSVF